MDTSHQLQNLDFAPWSLMAPDPAQSKPVARGGVPGDFSETSNSFKDILDETRRENAGTEQNPSGSVEDTGLMFGEDGFDLGDAIDIINPLQHLPIISSIYREITGDTIEPGARLAGGAIFGGPIGFAGALANTIMESHSGKDMGQTVMATLFGDDQDQQTDPVNIIELAAGPENNDTAATATDTTAENSNIQDALALNALLAQHFGKAPTPPKSDELETAEDLDEEGKDDQHLADQDGQNLADQDRLFDEDIARALEEKRREESKPLPENMQHLLAALEGRALNGQGRAEPQTEQSFTTRVASDLSQASYANPDLKRPLSIAELAAQDMNHLQNQSIASIARDNATIQSASMSNPFVNASSQGALSLDSDELAIANSRPLPAQDIPSAMAMALQKYRNAATLS